MQREPPDTLPRLSPSMHLALTAIGPALVSSACLDYLRSGAIALPVGKN